MCASLFSEKTRQFALVEVVDAASVRSRPAAEVAEVPGRRRQVVLVVARRRVHPPVVSAPRRAVAVRGTPRAVPSSYARSPNVTTSPLMLVTSRRGGRVPGLAAVSDVARADEHIGPWLTSGLIEHDHRDEGDRDRPQRSPLRARAEPRHGCPPASQGQSPHLRRAAEPLGPSISFARPPAVCHARRRALADRLERTGPGSINRPRPSAPWGRAGRCARCHRCGRGARHPCRTGRSDRAT